MAASEDENLKVFYRTMSTEQLLQYRAALAGDLQAARRTPHSSKHTVAFCTERRRLIADVLAERGVEGV